EAHHMQSAQERPNVGCRNGLGFDVANNSLQFAAVAHRRVGDEAFRTEPLLELGAVTRGTRAIEQADEVLQKSIRAAQRDEREAVVFLREMRAVEVFPEIG